jgi:hypothetical protein
MGLKWALSQICLFEAKCENRVLKNQWVASLSFPVFGNLRQNFVAPVARAWGEILTGHCPGSQRVGNQNRSLCLPAGCVVQTASHNRVGNGIGVAA